MEKKMKRTIFSLVSLMVVLVMVGCAQGSAQPTATLLPTALPPTGTTPSEYYYPTATEQPTTLPPTATSQPTAIPVTPTPQPTPTIPPTATVTFTPVKTRALKIEITLHEKWSAGVQEVVID